MIGNNSTTYMRARGFTLFFAMLVASLALAVGLAIYDLTIRELDLSDVATQSQYAIYAADTGAECALYWDAKYVNGATNNNGGSNSAFATSSADSEFPVNWGYCNGQTIEGGPGDSLSAISTAATTTFTIYVSAQSLATATTTCATVTVAKNSIPLTSTVVTAHGYNTCAMSPLRLERVFQVSY